MTFLELAKKDINYILSVQQGNFKDGWNENMLVSAFDEGRFYAIALEIDNLPIGLITFSVAVDTADIEGVVVVRSMRKKGYGLSLINSAEAKMKGIGIQKSFLEVRESNTPAISLYKKAGYTEVSVRKKYYNDGENAVVMVKEL